MTKGDLVDALVRRVHLHRRQAGDAVDVVLDEIERALAEGDRVALSPLGSFVVRVRKAREGRNPQTGEKLAIAERKVAAFLPGKSLKEAIDGSRKKTGSRT